MELMNQPFTGQLGNRLIELLGSSDYHTLNIVVAFAKTSGVLRIKDALKRFRERGGKVNVYVGVDLGGTSYEALTALLLTTDSLNVVHSEKSQTFHAKIYQFVGKSKGLVVVGSHNLTGGGLWTNFESSLIIPIGGQNAKEGELVTGLKNYIGQLSLLNNSFMSIGAQGDIDKLLTNGYVFKEVTEQIRQAKAVTHNENQERLFGNGAAAKLPRVEMSNKGKPAMVFAAPVVPVSVLRGEEEHTIWFETKSMTGGSRNILDLSKRSLIERGDPKGTPFDLGDKKFMRGGVEFFGLNPASTSEVKKITINFEGVDYEGNTILFPEGESRNGTWRLQIKGISASENKITDAFRAKGNVHFLVDKLITFTKIKDDYYLMSVFPDSELKNFEAASRILARNGSTRIAKRLGLL